MATITETIAFVVEVREGEAGAKRLEQALGKVTTAEERAARAATAMDDAVAKLGKANIDTSKTVVTFSDSVRKAEQAAGGIGGAFRAWKTQAEGLAKVGQQIGGIVRQVVPILGTVAVVLGQVGIEFGKVDETAEKAKKRLDEFNKAARDILNLQAQLSDRINDLSGVDRLDAIRVALGVAAKSLKELPDAAKSNNFATLDDARQKLEKLSLEAERARRELDRVVGVQVRTGNDFGVDRALKQFRTVEDALNRLRTLPANIGGAEFVPVAQFDALARAVPSVAEEIKKLEAQGVPGLIRLADATELVRETTKKLNADLAETSRADRYRAVIEDLKAQTNAQLDLNLAIEEGAASGLTAERAIQRGRDAALEWGLVQGALVKIQREGVGATEAQTAAIEREVRAFLAARDATRQLEERLKAAELASKQIGQGLADGVLSTFDAIERLGGAAFDVTTRAAKAVAEILEDATKTSRADPAIKKGRDLFGNLELERAALLRTRDAVDLLAIAEQARRDDLDATTRAALIGYAQQTQALARLRETADGAAGGIGDALRALKDGASGREALATFASSAGDRIFEASLGRLQEQLSAGITGALGGLFGVPAAGPGVTPGDSAIVLAVNQVRDAVLAGNVASGAGPGTGTVGTPAGFNFGGFLSSVGSGLFGFGLSLLARGGRGGSGTTPQEAGFNPRGTGAGGSSGSRTFQNVTVNNYVSPDAKRLTPRQIAAGRDAIWKR